jgi:hypothetical protein
VGEPLKRNVRRQMKPMKSITPGEIELYCYFARHLGPRFESAGLRIQFHYNQTPGIHLKANTSTEYKDAIIKGIREGLALRFPEFPTTASVWITEITEHPIDSSANAFYKAARAMIDQAFILVQYQTSASSIEGGVPNEKWSQIDSV